MWISQYDRVFEGDKEDPVTSYNIEIAAMLERALAMAYTGDVRTITKHSMEPFGLKPSLMELGLPSITNVDFFSNDGNVFALQPSEWPLTPSKEPAIASKRTQILTYGQDHYNVSMSYSIRLQVTVLTMHISHRNTMVPSR
jgi:hypothetical protein